MDSGSFRRMLEQRLRATSAHYLFATKDAMAHLGLAPAAGRQKLRAGSMRPTRAGADEEDIGIRCHRCERRICIFEHEFSAGMLLPRLPT